MMNWISDNLKHMLRTSQCLKTEQNHLIGKKLTFLRIQEKETPEVTENQEKNCSVNHSNLVYFRDFH